MSSVTPQLGKTIAQTYKHSGRVPASGLVLAALVLIPFAIIAGAIYSGAVVWVPFIKLRGLLTCAYGGALGAFAGIVCRQFKFRSNLFVAIATVLTFLVSYYASWALHQAFVIWRFDGMSDDVTASAISGFLPQNISAWATYIHDNGLWGVGNNGKAMAGIGICIVWAVELLAIGGIAWVSKSTYGTSPFCEDCNEWSEDTKMLAEMPVSPRDPAWQKFAAGDLDSIKRLQVVQDSPEFVELQLDACGSCENSDYLSAIGVTFVADKEGNIERKETEIVRHLQISHPQRNEIEQFAEMLKEAVAAMEDDGYDEQAETPESDA